MQIITQYKHGKHGKYGPIKYGVIFLLFLLFISRAVVVHAFSIEELTAEDINVGSMLEVEKDAISWSIFAKTKELGECKDDAQGLTICLIKPQYSPQIEAFDNKEVILMGFMFPLQQDELQTQFLLGPYPMSCPFHFHTRPSIVVEVLTAKPVKFSFDAVKLKGVLSLEYNQDTGVFYYLKEARLIK